MKAIRHFKISITCTNPEHLNFQQCLCKNVGPVTYRGYVTPVAEGNIWIQEGEKVVGKLVGLCNEDFHDLHQSTAVVGMIKSVGKK